MSSHLAQHHTSELASAQHYSKLLKTRLTALERRFIEERMASLKTGRLAPASGRSPSETLPNEEREPSSEDLHCFAANQPVLGWIADPTGSIYWYNNAWYAYTGASSERMKGSGWQSTLDPQSREAILDQWKKSIASAQPAEAIFPLRGADGIFRPFLTRMTPVQDVDGHLTHWLGNSVEITHLARPEQDQALLIRELHHRLSNIFTVFQSIINLTAKDAASVQELASTLRSRVTAQAKAHALIGITGASAQSGETPTTLRELLAVIVQNQVSLRQKVSLDGPPVPISLASTEPLTLIFHELTTNSAKYGALSTEFGTIEISWLRDQERLVVSWIESKGPELDVTSRRAGFGSQLLQLSIKALKGTMTTEWNSAELRICLSLPADH